MPPALRRLTGSRRRLVAVLTAPAALLVVAGVWAYLTATGSGVAAGSVGTVSAPTGVVASTTTGTGTVGVSWDASTLASGDAVDGYFVQRFSGSTPSAACGSSSSSLVTATTCDDTSVADGTYTYEVTAVYHTWTAVSAASNAVTVVNDATPPTTGVTFPVDGGAVGAAAYATGCTTPGVCGSASDDSGVQSVQVSIRQGSGDYWNGSAFASATEAFQSATLGTPNGKSTAWSYALARPADGAYTVHVQATDTVGNATASGTYSSTSTFTVDTVAPVVSLTSPAAGSYVDTATPLFQGTAGQLAGDSTTVTVKVYAGSTATGTPVETLTATASAGAWSAGASPALTADAQYTAQATQSDSAGNAGSSSASTFVVDTAAPAVTLTSPANGSATNSTRPTFSGAAGTTAASTTASADSSTITVRIYSGSDTTGTLVQTLTTTASAGAWSVAPTTALTANAQYTVQAAQSDTAGNVGLSSARTFVIDTAAPAVGLNDPGNANHFVSTTTPSFAGTAGTVAASTTSSADSTTVTVDIYTGTSATGTPSQTFSVTESAGSWSGTLPVARALSQGTYTAQAVQADGAGNSGTSTARTFTVDTVAPDAPTSVSLANGGGTGSAYIDIANKASLDVDVVLGSASVATDTVTLTITDAGAAHTVTRTASATAGAGTVHFTGVDASALSDGSVTLSATSTDQAANTSTSTTATATKDTVAPGAPTGLAYVDNNNPTADQITGTAEANAMITVTELSPTAQTFTGTATGGSFSITVDKLNGSSRNPKSFSYSVTATDAAGNTSTATALSGSDTN